MGCWLVFHRWGKWLDRDPIYLVRRLDRDPIYLVREVGDIARYEVEAQERVCQKCGRKQIRKTTDL